jgi:predicted transcriptional regulator
LNNWNINNEGTYLNNNKVSDVKLTDVNIDKCPYISFKIGVKEDAHNRGGINLFGSSFGDYDQDIIVKATW